jgi:DNA-binding response OmpR family regulator
MVGKAIILIVEDDAASAEMLAEMLAMAGYTAEIASTLDEAIAKLESGRYQAALLDLTLPGATMSQLVQQIRRVEARPPLAIFSARRSEDLRMAAEQLEAVAVLQKPAKMNVLLSTLERVVSAPGSQHCSLSRKG